MHVYSPKTKSTKGETVAYGGKTFVRSVGRFLPIPHLSIRYLLKYCSTAQPLSFSGICWILLFTFTGSNFRSIIDIKYIMAPPVSGGGGVKITGVPIHQTELTTLKKSILWKIKGINNIRSANAWEAATCQMDIGDTLWQLHLYSDGKYLYGIPTKIEPQNKPIVYTLKTSIVNNNDFVIHTPYAANKTAVTAGVNKDPHKWEIMKYGDATMDLFSNYVFDDTLKVLVEMTLHVQK